MCPVCITTAALVAAGAGSTGGLTAALARTLRRKRAAAPVVTDGNPERRDEPMVAHQADDQGARK